MIGAATGAGRDVTATVGIAPADHLAATCARAVLTDPVIWLLVALGLALRLMVGWLLLGRPLVGDEAEYLAAARVLADGRGFSYYDAAPWLRPPAYPLLLALLARGPVPLLTGIAVVQMGSSLVLGPLIAWIGWLAIGQRTTARLAAGLTLALLPLAVLPWLALTETLFTLLLLGALGSLLARLRGGSAGWLVAVGACLGAACLLRGVAVGAVALAGLVVVVWSDGRWRRRLRDVVLLLAVVVVMLAPWTARNWLAYRALIPLETTASYNLWLRAQGGRGESWMLGELLEQPDPAARQAHALQRATALIQRDPAAYLARGGSEVGDVVRLNFGAAERFMAGHSAGEISRWWLALSLLLDDALYLALLPLAALGLALRGGPLRWLTLGWLGWLVVLAAVFFAITRFRAPALPLLALQAAIALVEWRAVVAALRVGRPVVWLGAAVGLLALGLAAGTLDGWAYRDGWQQRAGWEAAALADRRRLAGDPAGALDALAPMPVDSIVTAMARALALAALGQTGEAEATLTPYRADPRALVALGEVRRLAGDPAGAARYWGTRAVDLANPLDWAWSRLNQPGPRVDIGDGLDLGLVRGMHGDERDSTRRFRWTNGHGQVRLPSTTQGPALLAASLRSFRPAGAATVVRVRLNDREIATWSVSGEWTEYTAPVTLDGAEVVVELVSDDFVQGYADPRSLGVMVDWVEVRTTRVGASVEVGDGGVGRG